MAVLLHTLSGRIDRGESSALDGFIWQLSILISIKKKTFAASLSEFWGESTIDE